VIKRCLYCRKMLWKKYDELRLATADGERVSYLCLPHADEMMREGDTVEQSVRVGRGDGDDEERPDPFGD
jgi:hypothetical protein